MLCEGAQGTLLDLDHGTYPFVTSSNPVAGAAATGIGIGPNRIDAVLGVAKAYVTRVGEGPFPTEIEGPDQERVRELGHEFGTTTGRERRCGWLDLVALRYAVRVNGISSLALTKLDVLSAFAELPVCVRYRLEDGRETDEFPAHQSDFHHCRPVYETLAGWRSRSRRSRSSTSCRRPRARTSSSSSAELEVDVTLVGTGAERERVLARAGRGGGRVKVLLVGSGGREHALAWRLAQTDGVELHAAPGNPGHRAARRVPSGAGARRGGPALARADARRRPRRDRARGAARHGRRRRAAARGHRGLRAERGRGADRGLEELREGGHARERRADGRVAAGGEAAVRGQARRARRGQGRLGLPDRPTELDGGAAERRPAGGQVVIEELLEGEEVSVFALCDGTRALPLAPARDFKRLADGDEGPNTGGMGSYSPVAELGAERLAELVATVHAPVLDELARRGTPFVGLLYAGLMLTEDGLARARVQLPLRRPRDAVDPAAARGRPLRRRSPPRRPATSATRS